MKKKVSSSAWMCPPSTSASVITITLPYLIPDKSTSSSIECGSTPIAVAIACSSLLASTVRLSLDMVFSTLPRSGSTACVSLSRASFAEPPAESPSTRNSSFRVTSPEAQSTSLPGSVAMPEDFFLSTFLPLESRASACSIASSTIFAPSSGCSPSHSSKASRTHISSSLAAWRVVSFSFVWPWNCVRTMRAESVKQARCHRSSGISFTPLGARPRVSMNAARASKIPARKPASCVPPERVGIRLTWLSAKVSPSATQPMAQLAPSPGSISGILESWKKRSPVNRGAINSRPCSTKSKYCAMPRSYFQVFFSLPSISRIIVRPGSR